MEQNCILLVADDNFLTRNIVANFFKKRGCSILMAENGKEAYDIFKKNQKSISVIISDIEMPEMTGLELCKKVKEINNKILFYIITLRIEEEVNTEGIKIDGFLKKDFREENLEKELSIVLNSVCAKKE